MLILQVLNTALLTSSGTDRHALFDVTVLAINFYKLTLVALRTHDVANANGKVV